MRGTLGVVVAHPDDESFWFGGTLLALRRVDLRIVVICLTNGRNPVRAEEFREACASIGVEGVMLDYPDGATHALCGVAPHVLAELDRTADSPLLGIITHPPHGNERGHPQHVSCFAEISQACAVRNLPFGFFSETLVTGLAHLRETPIDEGIRLVRLKHRWATVLQPEIAAVLRNPLRPGRYLSTVRRWRQLRNAWRTPTHVFRVEIDVASKHRVLALYKSQVAGLREYETYDRVEEYLYANGALCDVLTKSFARCHSS